MIHEAIISDLLQPKSPHDSLNFDQLSGSYNFRNISDRRLVFVSAILEEIRKRKNAAVLDIGCGNGIGIDRRWQWAIRAEAGRLLGVEPDETVDIEPGLFDEVTNSTFELAGIAEDSIDVAYSYMVMEHVEHPQEFIASLARCLKPGGVYYFLTPNGKHYFTRIANLFRKMGISDAVLRLVRPASDVDEYHYPVQYRFNDAKQIDKMVTAAGFLRPKFAYVEKIGPLPYLPGPSKILFYIMDAKRRLIRDPNCLLSMLGRIERSS